MFEYYLIPPHGNDICYAGGYNITHEVNFQQCTLTSNHCV